MFVIICGFDASPIYSEETSHNDVLSSDVLYTKEQEEMLKGFQNGEAQIGRLERNYLWPMGPEGFVLVPISIQKEEGYSKFKILLDCFKKLLI